MNNSELKIIFLACLKTWEKLYYQDIEKFVDFWQEVKKELEKTAVDK